MQKSVNPINHGQGWGFTRVGFLGPPELRGQGQGWGSFDNRPGDDGVMKAPPHHLALKLANGILKDAKQMSIQFAYFSAT